MGIGNTEWTVRDSFGDEWRIDLAPPDGLYRLEQLVYFAFSRPNDQESETARILARVYDAATGDDLAGRLERGETDHASALPLVERKLSALYRAGTLRIDRLPRPAFVFDSRRLQKDVEPDLDVPVPEQTAWVGIHLVDEDGAPAKGARYRITPPSGIPTEGTLDEDGRALLDGIDPGRCDVEFPELAAAPA